MCAYVCVCVCHVCTQVSDLHNGTYLVHYNTPAPGSYLVHVSYNELGTSENVPIRGSPFTIDCQDPWVKHRVMGTFPARRKGMTLVTMGSELVAYGGDKSGVSVCNTEGADWRWQTVTPEGEAPADRTLHSATVVGDSMVIFGGTSLASNDDLNDMFTLCKEGEGWVWTHPANSQPYIRHPDPTAEQAEEGSGEGAAPAEGEGEGAGEGEEGAGSAEQAPANNSEPRPVTARNSHTAVAIDRDLYVLNGDNAGDMMREFAMVDTSDTETANWMEPILAGDIPAPRRSAAAACTGNKIFMFGGVISDPAGQNQVVDDLIVFEVTGPNNLTCQVNPPTHGHAKPPARQYPIMQEYCSGKVFLCGGLDASNKPFNDAWLFDVATHTWECVYNGHSDLVVPTGNVATLLNGRMVVLNSAAGSPKLDIVQSLDFVAAKESYEFLTKMKTDGPALLEALEAWCDKQAHGMELARNVDAVSKNFDSLLKVMDALFQVRETVCRCVCM